MVGGSGSGKSTLMNMIIGLMIPNSGKLLIDGKNIEEVNLSEYRSHISVVPQNSILFAGTIRENITYGLSRYTEEQLLKVADMANLWEFVNELPNGLDTEIGEHGAKISGGQKQRLAIARALSKNAPIYVFDDSFSALDFKTDKALRAALAQELSRATIIIVAQRVGTIKNADQIIVLDDGRIVGKGKHEDLLKNCDVYREIAKSQLSEEELGI